jgi:hypothetical protein
MARRSVPPPKPKSPILTIGQRRRRIERVQKCITDLEAFDSKKERLGNTEVVTLEAAIDKALSSAFGYGTPAYMRFNQAATLDPARLITQRPHLAPPPRVRLVAHEDTMRRLKKRANIFPTARSGRSPCSAKRLRHLKTKSRMGNRSPMSSRSQRRHRNHRLPTRRAKCRRFAKPARAASAVVVVLCARPEGMPGQLHRALRPRSAAVRRSGTRPCCWSLHPPVPHPGQGRSVDPRRLGAGSAHRQPAARPTAAQT